MSKVAGFMRERLKSPTVFITHVLAEIWGCSIFFESCKLPVFHSLGKPEGISVACNQKNTE